MNKKKVFFFIFNGFADWEAANALAEINKCQRYAVETVGLNRDPVRSMGGLTVFPDQGLADLALENTALLILPGGTAWEEKKLRELIPVVQEFNNRGIPIAAVCAATTLLADAGLLDKISHSSNAKSYLKSASVSYQGEAYYKDELAVSDSNIITASGIAPLEFAREIFLLLEIFDDLTLEKWYGLFKSGILPW
jgi:putative intracellular protease/amidase